LAQHNQFVVSVENLHKFFHNLHVLKGIDLDIAEHELTVCIGPSGCGKTTFLRCLNCLEVMDKGKISIAGIILERKGTSPNPGSDFHAKSQALRKQVGMVFQSFNLFPHMTVLQNIMKAPMIVKGISESQAKEKALDLLQKVGLATHANHYPTQISGGQQQRAAIARALAMEPKVMLYDEPTSALDPGLVDEVLAVMKKLHDEGMTQIVVTHEMRFARDVSDKIAYFEEGKIVEIAPPEIMFKSPQDERTKKFLKHYL
jgi:polar amino acid transport system ATP-binding protein